MLRQGSNWRDQESRTNFCHHIFSTKLSSHKARNLLFVWESGFARLQ